MDNDLVKHILIYSGVTATDCSAEYERLYNKLSDYFLTPDNEKWFKRRYYESVSALLNQIGCCPVQRFLFWELFSFGLLNACKNNEAIKSFDTLKINRCYLLQLPEYNLRSNPKPSYCLKGEYDVSLIEDDDREMLFNLLKKDIKRDNPIPFWVIDNISSSVGKEIYAFDDSMDWVLVLNHENEIYFHKTKKQQD